jgi:hypothetical protein
MNMSEEISSFLDDHGTKETCCMLLQIICNPHDTYQLNLSSARKNDRLKKSSRPWEFQYLAPTKGYGYTPMSKYEEQKGYESEEENSKETEKGIEKCDFKKPHENVIEYAKSIFYKISNTFPSYPSSKNVSLSLNTQRMSFANNLATKENEVQSIKLTSLYLYLSRILQPVFKNYLVYITSLKEDGEYFPNMGVSEKRVVGSKLTQLLQFIKNEDKFLKKLDKEDRDTRDFYKEKQYKSHTDSLNYENIIYQEAEQIDYLKSFLLRWIISIDFIEEIGKVPADFTKAIQMLSKEDKRVVETYQFRDLTQNITGDQVFIRFTKKLLEIKAANWRDLKEAKRMWETWNKKWGVFIDREFINVFIAEYQLHRLAIENKINEEILSNSLRELTNYPMRFDVENVVKLLIRLKRLIDLVKLLWVRFLFIQEYEEQESKIGGRENHIKLDHSFYRMEESAWVTPILEILTKVYETYVDKIEKTTSAFNILTSLIDYRKEQTIYDYLHEEYLKNLTVENLIRLKTDLIGTILLHDSEKLHNTVLTWMTEKDLYEDLEQVTSKYYDKFSEKLENKSCLNIYQVALVYKYLLKTQNYNRVISFLVPLIACDTNDEKCKIKGKFSIKQRLLYLEIAENACRIIAKNVESQKSLDSIQKSLDEFKEVLLLQSNIENILMKILKEKITKQEEQRLKSKIEEINSKLFGLDELIEKMTKPFKLYDFTISILRIKVGKEGKVSKYLVDEIDGCYYNILKFYANEAKQHYPHKWYDKFMDLAKLYYIDQVEIKENKMPIKKCNDSLKKCFFPIDKILIYVENFNKIYYEKSISDVKFIDEAFNDHKVKVTPYWFVALLQEINEDCLSYNIRLLNNRFKEENSVYNLCSLVVAIKRYREHISEIDEATMDPNQRFVLQEFRQFELSFKQIVADLLVRKSLIFRNYSKAMRWK